jgi:hypothetical protein
MKPPTIETMASGNPSLTITEDTAWETFPDQAADFVRRFGGIVLKRIDTPVERMWIVLIKWKPFYLTFEDFPLRMTLDPMNRSCASVIHDIHAELLAEAQSQKPA